MRVSWQCVVSKIFGFMMHQKHTRPTLSTIFLNIKVLLWAARLITIRFSQMLKFYFRPSEHMAPKNHLLGIFGNFSWNGGGVKNLKTFAEKIKWEQVYEPIEEKGALKVNTTEELLKLADAMADRLLEIPKPE